MLYVIQRARAAGTERCEDHSATPCVTPVRQEVAEGTPFDFERLLKGQGC
jgi:hypothetical protein